MSVLPHPLFEDYQIDVFIHSRRRTACVALTWPTVTELFGTLGQMGVATAAHVLQRKRCRRTCTLT